MLLGAKSFLQKSKRRTEPAVMSNLEKQNGSVEIREVWESNLEEEFSLIRSINLNQFPFVAIDTEFPGVPIRPPASATGAFHSYADSNYHTLKANVDLLKLIQLGLTFSDSSGRLPLFGSPPRPRAWQFNFREFDEATDIFAADSIHLLRNTGIDFDKNRRLGVAAPRFARLFMSSGILHNNSIHWITFHSSYDFGYLLKMLTWNNPLPDTQKDFFKFLRSYFPNVYDIKYLMKFCDNLYGGLNKLAEVLQVERVGISHQAGSDSLLTAATFKKLKDSFFSNRSTEGYAGVLYGLSAH